MRIEIRERIFHAAVAVLLEVSQKTGVQRRILKRRLEIEQNPVPLPRLHMRGGGKRHRAGQSKMREQQLSKVGIYGFPLRIQKPERRVPQGKPLHFAAVAAVTDERHERTYGRQNGMAERRRHAVAVSRGAGQGIGNAARAENRCGAGKELCAVRNAADPAVVQKQPFRSALPAQHAALLHRPRQCRKHIRGTVGHREHALPPLGLQRAAIRFKELHCTLRRKGKDAAVQKAAVSGDVFQNLFRRTCICNITSSLSGDEKLLSAAGVFLQKQDTQATACGMDRGKHSGGSPADDNHISRQLFHRRHNGPTPFPDCQRFP